MKIFEKRPLAIILCVMLGGFSFFTDFIWQFKLICAAVILALILQMLIFKTLKIGRKAFIVVILSALCLSLVLSAIWSLTFYPRAHYGKNVSVTARVYDIDNSLPYSTKIVCKSKKINDKRDKHTFIAYVDKDTASALTKYDNISFKADVSELTSQDDGFDGRSYYVSKGYSAFLEDITDLEVIDNSPDRLDSLFKGLQLRISNRLKLRTDYNTGAFLSALIVGNRDDLSGSVKLDFARLGISHVLALSGMHLAILSLALNSLLTRVGVKKKLRVIIMITSISFYIALTGFSASVLRSGLMLIISGAIFLLSSKADAVTSLFISVFLIVLFNPTAVFDLSLWLSAFATLGVIAFSEIAEKPDKDTGLLVKMLIALKNGCLISVFAFAATFAFTALRFDGFSVISVFTTIIFSFVIQILIYGGLLVLIIGRFVPIGKLIAVFSDAIIWLAETISSLKLIYVSVDFFITKLLIVLVSLFFFAFLVFDVEKKKRATLTLVLLLVSVFISAEIGTFAVRRSDDAIYTASTSGDTVLLKSDSEVSVIYSGRAISTAAKDVVQQITDARLTYVDTFFFASYSHSTLEFAQIMIDGVRIEKIMLPVPTTDEELGQAEGISYLLSDYGTYLEFYEARTYIDVGEYQYCLFEKDDYTYGESPANVFEIVLGKESFTYVSACDYSSLSPSGKALLFNTENLIIGSTTGNQDDFEMLLPDIKCIYLSDGATLSHSAKEYYNEKGASTKNVKTPLSFLN